MAGKARNRKPLESAVLLAVDILALARMPAGWAKHGKATRAVTIQHRHGRRTIAETRVHAVVERTAGVAMIQHSDIDGTRIKQSLGLAPVAQHFGGQRWFFVCPVTGDRARKLYWYPGLQQFCSRRGLPEPATYHCQRDSGAKRVMRQIWELRRRIGVNGPLLGAFDKPGGMSDAEFIRYGCRYLELASRLDLSNREFRFRRNNATCRPTAMLDHEEPQHIQHTQQKGSTNEQIKDHH